MNKLDLVCTFGASLGAYYFTQNPTISLASGAVVLVGFCAKNALESLHKVFNKPKGPHHKEIEQNLALALKVKNEYWNRYISAEGQVSKLHSLLYASAEEQLKALKELQKANKTDSFGRAPRSQSSGGKRNSPAQKFNDRLEAFFVQGTTNLQNEFDLGDAHKLLSDINTYFNGLSDGEKKAFASEFSSDKYQILAEIVNGQFRDS